MSRRSLILLGALLLVAPGLTKADWNSLTPLSGASIRPDAVATAGTGTLKLTYDSLQNALTLELSSQSLSSDILLATINAVAPGGNQRFDNGPVVINIAAASGEIPPILGSAASFTFPTVTVNPSASVLQALQEQRAYVIIGTQGNPNGEIRGNIIPEPSSMALTGLGIVAMGWYLRARRRVS
ncbi:MAG: CHRD domain-containing protein [Isosphaeraceae bacterium]|nr:CHRD domain-containing protein [Isosphaeraceae bacterium]